MNLTCLPLCLPLCLASLWNVISFATGVQATQFGAFQSQELPTGGGVWVVDASGAGDFLDLPDAVAAASAGDLVLVRSAGTAYSGFELDGKGLTIVGQGSTQPAVVGRVRVQGLASGQAAVLRNLSLSRMATDGGVLELLDCAGGVWVEDCAVTALGVPVAGYPPPDHGLDGIVAEDCDSVVLVRVAVDGTASPVEDPAPRRGVFATRCNLSLWDSVVTGPDGHDAAGVPDCEDGFPYESNPQQGGTAVSLDDSFAFLSRCLLQGGNGGRGSCCSGCGSGPLCCWHGARDGGIGLEVWNSQASYVDTSLLGGAAGSASFCAFSTCLAAQPGHPLVGTAQAIAGTSRSLIVSSPALLGGSYTLQVNGQPGELVYAAYSSTASAVWWENLDGVQLTGLPVSLSAVGVVPITGRLSRSIPLPSLSRAGHFDRFVQSLHFLSDGSVRLGSGSALQLVSSL